MYNIHEVSVDALEVFVGTMKNVVDKGEVLFNDVEVSFDTLVDIINTREHVTYA